MEKGALRRAVCLTRGLVGDEGASASVLMLCDWEEALFDAPRPVPCEIPPRVLLDADVVLALALVDFMAVDDAFDDTTSLGVDILTFLKALGAAWEAVVLAFLLVPDVFCGFAGVDFALAAFVAVVFTIVVFTTVVFATVVFADVVFAGAAFVAAPFVVFI